MEKIEGSCRTLPLACGTLITVTLLTPPFSIPNNLGFLLFSLDKIFNYELGLTGRRRLISTGIRRAPKVHPSAVDARRPCQVHRINII